MRAAVGATLALTLAAAPLNAPSSNAQTAPPGGPVPSVYVQEAVLSTLPTPQAQRATRSCTVTAVLRQWCGTATSCDVGSQPRAGQPSFFVARAADIAQICNLQLSQATDFRVTYRCRYGEQLDGTIIQESRGIALDDTGAPLGRSAFRVLMACH